MGLQPVPMYCLDGRDSEYPLRQLQRSESISNKLGDYSCESISNIREGIFFIFPEIA